MRAMRTVALTVVVLHAGAYIALASGTNTVIYAADIPDTAMHGAWSKVVDATAAGQTKLTTTDTGSSSLNNPLTAPADYVDISFPANANTSYTLWIRLQARANSKFNDSVWVQFADARVNGSIVYPIG